MPLWSQLADFLRLSNTARMLSDILIQRGLTKAMNLRRLTTGHLFLESQHYFCADAPEPIEAGRYIEQKSNAEKQCRKAMQKTTMP